MELVGPQRVLLNKNMVKEDKARSLELKVKEITEKIDKKAFAGAVGIMSISWFALPIVYWLIVKAQKKNDVEKHGGEHNGN